ncbi:MAG: hypothetical protein U0X20_26380 [Caldilineaceae bacterium]
MRNVFLAAILCACAALLTTRPAAAQDLPRCSWPLETSVDSLLNVAYPDTNAAYWTMPIDTSRWSSVIITGTFPSARFMSFTTYDAQGQAVEGLFDYQIVPDPGSTNPFVPGPTAADGNESYTILVTRGDQAVAAAGEQRHAEDVKIYFPAVLKRGSPGIANTLSLSSTTLGWITYRIYVPDRGENLQGSIDLPGVTLIGFDGSRLALAPCSKRDVASLPANGFADVVAAIERIIAAAGSSGGGDGTICAPDQVAFAIPKITGGYFPNPANKYIAAPDLCYQSGRVVVVRGKAGGFPNTYNGAPVWQPPSQFTQVDLRYWSMCNNNQQQPYPVVQCAADWQTDLDNQDYYTYVVAESVGGKRPAWLPGDLVWLPWGSKTARNILIFRNMLPTSGFDQSVQAALAAGCIFDNTNSPVPYQDIAAAAACAKTVMGPYYPTAVYCDMALIEANGWQACFAAAGVPLP